MAEPLSESPSRERAEADDRRASAPDRVVRTVWDWRAAGGAADAAAVQRRASRARREGLLRAVVGLVAAGLLWLWKPVLAAVVLAITLAILALALASPLGAYRALSAGLERFGHWVGLAVTWVLMSAIFYLLFLPVGLVLRGLGRLGLTFGAERGRASYWEPVAWERVRPETYRRQF